MVEITRIFTVEITAVDKAPEEKILPKEEAKQLLKKRIEKYLNCDIDNVNVTNVQDFIRELGENDA